MKDKQKIKQQQKQRRQARVRAKIFGTSEKPRLSVKRSLRYIYAQVIDDLKGQTLAASSDLDQRKHRNQKTTESTENNYKGKEAVAYLVGKDLAEKAKAAGIKKVVFDRAGYRYHGRVKALAEGARAGGLEF